MNGICLRLCFMVGGSSNQISTKYNRDEPNLILKVAFSVGCAFLRPPLFFSNPIITEWANKIFFVFRSRLKRAIQLLAEDG
jgi:hypothetical protein